MNCPAFFHFRSSGFFPCSRRVNMKLSAAVRGEVNMPEIKDPNEGEIDALAERPLVAVTRIEDEGSVRVE